MQLTNSPTRKILIVALGAVFIACSDEKAAKKTAPAKATVVSESHGEVDSAREADATGWLSDENILSLGRVLNSEQMAAANWELEHWHTGAVRDFAAQMAHDHSSMQNELDSVGTAVKIVPVVPALAAVIDSAARREIDAVAALTLARMEQAYIRQQIASHERMIDQFRQLGAAADRPELSAVFNAQSQRLQTHLASAKTLVKTMAADSARVADSTHAADSARAARRRPGRQD